MNDKANWVSSLVNLTLCSSPGMTAIQVLAHQHGMAGYYEGVSVICLALHAKRTARQAGWVMLMAANELLVLSVHQLH